MNRAREVDYERQEDFLREKFPLSVVKRVLSICDVRSFEGTQYNVLFRATALALRRASNVCLDKIGADTFQNVDKKDLQKIVNSAEFERNMMFEINRFDITIPDYAWREMEFYVQHVKKKYGEFLVESASLKKENE